MNLSMIAKFLKEANPKDVLAIFPDIQGLIADRERRKLSKLSQKYHVPVPQMRIKRECFWPDGSPMWKAREDWGHSPVRNYYNMVFAWANMKCLSDSTPFGTGYLNVKDTGGVIRYSSSGYFLKERGSTIYPNIDTRNADGGILAAAGDAGLGIVIGTDSTAWDFEQYVLLAPIANGSAAGQMDYSQSELHSISNDTLTLKDTRVRDFNNNSGNSITVEELGEYVDCGWNSPANTYTAMIVRDLTGGDAVADTGQYRVTLECTLVYPA